MILEEKLVFIVSQPRSGSTLLQKLISNNDYVDTVSEPWLMLPVLSVLQPELIQAKYNYKVAIRGLNDFLAKKDKVQFFRKRLKDLVLELYEVKRSDQFFIDKTPRNYEILDILIQLFPESKFLILKRNPFGSLYSMLTTWSNGKVDYKAFAGFYRDFLTAPFLIQNFSEKHSSLPNIYEIRYENMVTNPNAEIGKVYAWLGIPFSGEAVLEFSKNEKVKGIFGDDVYKDKPTNQILEDRSDGWRKNVTRENLDDFFHSYQNYLTKEFLNRYGYSEEPFVRKRSFRKNEFDKYISLLRSENRL